MKKMTKMLFAALIALVSVSSVYLYRNLTTDATIERLLAENTELKAAISNLTEEENIGYAKVLSQTWRDGKLFTRIVFVETAPDDVNKQVFREEFEIAGDIIHFDTMVVKFSAALVADGKERAIYMWRRVYGEATAPEDAPLLHRKGKPSPRYESLCKKLSLRDSELFWNEIWALSDDPARLEKSGITAVFGNVVYKRLRPGVMYIFKANPTGGIHPETIPLI